MNYFENIELFQDLTVEDQLQLSSFCQEQHMNSGEILFKQGDEPQAMYVISSGSFLIQKEIN
jgi:CRP-like cAMP-binding protein